MHLCEDKRARNPFTSVQPLLPFPLSDTYRCDGTKLGTTPLPRYKTVRNEAATLERRHGGTRRRMPRMPRGVCYRTWPTPPGRLRRGGGCDAPDQLILEPEPRSIPGLILSAYVYVCVSQVVKSLKDASFLAHLSSIEGGPVREMAWDR